MPSSWNKQLKQELKNLVKPKSENGESSSPRLVIIGVGNEFKSDDAVGPLVAKRLLRLIPLKENLLILDAGIAPENFTGTLRRFRPDLVILIDAVDLNLEPGTITWLTLDSLVDVGGFTHASAPAMFNDFINHEIHCKIALIGIQPLTFAFDGKLSKEIKMSEMKVVAGIKRTLTTFSYF